MKIDQEEFNRKAQHIVETVVKPQVEKYEQAKAAGELKPKPRQVGASGWIFEEYLRIAREYYGVTDIEQAAANLADPNVDKTENWIAGAKYESERMHSILAEMFTTLKYNAVDNISTIHNVDLFIKSWTREFKNKQQGQ